MKVHGVGGKTEADDVGKPERNLPARGGIGDH